MIKAVVFDLDNTLIDFKKMKESAVDAAVEAMVDAGLRLPPEHIKEKIYEVYEAEGIEYQKVFDLTLTNLGMILPIVLLTRRFPSGFTRQLMIRKPPPRMTLYVVLATFAAIVVIDFIYILSLKVMPAPEDYVDTLRDLKPDGALSLIITGIGLCVAVPVAEEIIFRGVIQRVFARSMGVVLAAVLAGVFFGVIHLNLQLLISMTVFGIYLGFLFMLTSNLIYTVFAHAILNSIAFVQLIFAVEEDMTTAPFYLQEYWMLAVGLALLGVFLAKIKKEASKNDSEATLTGLEDSK